MERSDHHGSEYALLRRQYRGVDPGSGMTCSKDSAVPAGPGAGSPVHCVAEPQFPLSMADVEYLISYTPLPMADTEVQIQPI